MKLLILTTFLSRGDLEEVREHLEDIREHPADVCDHLRSSLLRRTQRTKDICEHPRMLAQAPKMFADPPQRPSRPYLGIYAVVY